MSTNFPCIGIGRGKRQFIYTIVFCFYLLLSNWNTVVYGQHFDWSWASQVHGTHTDAINEVNSNIKGDILVTGTFYSTAIDWDNTIVVNPYENESNGIYLGKLNTQGELLWTNKIFRAPGNSSTSIYFNDADLNALGESFVSGHVYYNGIIVDSVIYPTDDNYSSSGFVTRFDTNGKIVWVHVFEDGCDVNSVVADPYGGFYIMGNMYWYCDKINFGDTILNSIESENQAYIAHYNNNNTVDWAKLVQGHVENIHGQLTNNGDLLISGDYQINGYLDTLTIDDLTITCPPSVYFCSFWGLLNLEGDAQWLYNIAEQDISVTTKYITNDGYQQRISFYDPFIIVQGDTIYANGGGYTSIILAEFDFNGVLQKVRNIPDSYYGEYYYLYKSPFDKWFASISLTNTIVCGGEILINESLDSDPVLMELDTAFNSISCYQQELNYSSDNAQFINWDRFGNMIMVGNFSGDTLVFGEDVLTNYQLQSQFDYYIAYGNDCDTVLHQLTIANNLLHAPDGIAWNWYFNNELLPQEVAQDFLPLHAGYYTASATQNNGCVKWTKPFRYFDGVENNPIFIYPNPASSNCTVLLPPSCNFFNIFDLTGKLVYTCVPSEEFTLDLSYLSSGTYYIKSGNKDAVYTKKIIIL